MIEFHLLGEIALRDGTGAAIDAVLRQPKRLALLAYLASPVPGSWHRRDTLLGLFWPELDASRARTALRNAVYVLRQSLGEAVIVGRGDEELSIDPTHLATDVAAVRAALARGDAPEAIASYAGELLPGLYPSDSAGFERWLDQERNQLRIMVSRAGAAWSASLEAGGNLDAALAAARRIVAINPDDEPLVRRLMTLHVAMGDRSGGLAAFEEFRARLSREFEAEPAEETAALAEQLRASSGAASRRTTVAAGVHTAGPVIPAADHRASEPAAAAPTSGDRPEGSRRLPWAMITAVAIVPLLILAGAALLRRDGHFTLGTSRPVTVEEGMQIEPALSPNGRLVAFTSGTMQRMRIRVTRVDGGPIWQLTNDTAAIEQLPRWSPDNDALVYLSRHNAYVAPAVGGTPVLLASGGDDATNIRSASWSPHGDSVAIVRSDSLLVVPRTGRGTRFVGRGEEIHSCAWSPDGGWIACVSGNWIGRVPGTLFGNRAPSAIVLFPATGGEPIRFTDRDHQHHSPAWSPDGSELWFLSDRDGMPGEVYAASVGRDGRSPEAFRRVGLNAEFISMAEGGIVYSAASRRANVWAFPIDLDRLQGIESAERVTSGNQVVEVVHASTDGGWLIFDSNMRGNPDIYRLALSGGAPERLTNDDRPEYAASLSPDGREVAFHIWEDGNRRLRLLRIDDGSVTEPLAMPGNLSVPRWSPDGKALAVWEHGSEPGSVFISRRDDSGEWAIPEWTVQRSQLPIWSADGGELHFLTIEGGIRTMSADSGEVRTLHEPADDPDSPRATFLALDRAGRGIWFLAHDASGIGSIWLLPRGGEAPKKLVDLADPLGRSNGPSLTTDGRRLYITLEERLSNIRLTELVTPGS